jgi:hypothetical protein
MSQCKVSWFLGPVYLLEWTSPCEDSFLQLWRLLTEKLRKLCWSMILLAQDRCKQAAEVWDSFKVQETSLALCSDTVHTCYRPKCVIRHKNQTSSRYYPVEQTLCCALDNRIKVTLVARPLLKPVAQMTARCIHQQNLCSFWNITATWNRFLQFVKHSAMCIRTGK